MVGSTADMIFMLFFFICCVIWWYIADYEAQRLLDFLLINGRGVLRQIIFYQAVLVRHSQAQKCLNILPPSCIIIYYFSTEFTNQHLELAF